MSVIWIHEDAITLDHPAVTMAGEGAEIIFIWDTERHDEKAYSLKRRVFIYECALDLGVKIMAGHPYNVLRELVGEQTIYTAWSPDPDYREIIADLRDTHEVKVIEAPGLVSVPDDVDTKRFFRFWNRAKKSAMTRSHQVLESETA